MPTRRGERPFPDRRYLREGWECCSTPAGVHADPSQLPAGLDWIGATVPCTAAEALRSAGRWSLDAPARRFDAEDWWFRTTFNVDGALDTSACTLTFAGLATLCDVWLNGALVLRSDNMFLEQQVGSLPLKAGRNALVLQFHALDRALERKRPRPRWRAPMVEHQQLRWHRTTLLGRTPGWSPPAAAVGPWRPIFFDLGASAFAEVEALEARMQAGQGKVRIRIRAAAQRPDSDHGMLRLLDDGKTVAQERLRPTGDGRLEAELTIPEPRLWWPHTHGRPHLYEAVLGEDQRLGGVGFRSVRAPPSTTDSFEIHLNDTRIFARGACWTPLDVVSLRTDEAACRQAIEQVVDAGFNMLRVSGAMTYEDDLFLDLCDEYGILVWQDFMFANMDYPADDAGFSASVDAEAVQHLRRWARHPCVTVVCGNSEVSQQAAMWGAARELWNPELFARRLAALTHEHCAGVIYWPSSAYGGALPHQPDAGTTSYYGLGAYLRGLEDPRQSGLVFATECLAFANIPEDETLRKLPGGSTVRVQQAGWKQRSPRDLGAGWDFDDVRDHYVREFFGVDAAGLRYSDHGRYLQLGREATSIAMEAAFTEWRRGGSRCHGALLWFLRDLWPGAGWGIIDSGGLPKSPYYGLRRTLQPLAIGLTDEGLNGLSLQLCNETPDDHHGTLELRLYREGRQLLREVTRAHLLPARAAQTLPVAELLGEFHDLTFAYRFGPLSCDLVVARWLDNGLPQRSCQTRYLPDQGRHLMPEAGIELTARARRVAPGMYAAEVSSNAFVRGVCLHADGFHADDAYFWLAPGETREVMLRAVGAPRPLFGVVTALNLSAPVKFDVSG